MVSTNPGCFIQITRALGDQGNALHVAHIAKVIDAPVRSRPNVVAGEDRSRWVRQAESGVHATVDPSSTAGLWW
jgi:hypothetical protein